ncbi:hypothetical protein GUJ93_ZPchr0002g23963 [Zizania palustris]|uniref:Uncharacterized protein n=1 Tax=Zizania palustris TaxID=103762 RepID=A0A8J5V3C6_ZIZPA|nr:hypothetical protein GUJ93_ZPchr0002g23963 [Zizania palustris]
MEPRSPLGKRVGSGQLAGGRCSAVTIAARHHALGRLCCRSARSLARVEGNALGFHSGRCAMFKYGRRSCSAIGSDGQQRSGLD